MAATPTTDDGKAEKPEDPPKRKASNGAAVPDDAHDIAAAWLPTGLDDPLAETGLLSVPLGRPRDFFRTHPDPSHRVRAEIFEHKVAEMIGSTFYLIGPAMRGLVTSARPYILVCVIDRIGKPRLWPLRLPLSTERDYPAWVQSRAAARKGLNQWVRIEWVGNSHVTHDAEPGYAAEPDWSKVQPFDELATLAFGTDGVIHSKRHPIYRALYGIPDKPDTDGDL
jgi:hypothetical protein